MKRDLKHLLRGTILGRGSDGNDMHEPGVGSWTLFPRVLQDEKMCITRL